jgi:hypothetical protein
MGNFITQDQWENQDKKGGHCPHGHITDPRNTRMEEMSRRQRRTKASSEEGQGPGGAVAPWMDGWTDGCFPLLKL